MIDVSQLKWISSHPHDVDQFRQTSWNGINIRISATGLDECKVFVSGGGTSRNKEGLPPCDATKWALEQAEEIYKEYLERFQKDKVATIQAVDKCIAQ